MLFDDQHDMKVLKQKADKLAECLEAYKLLLDNQDIVRNIDYDNDFAKFAAQASRITMVISNAEQALKEYGGAK